VAGQGLGEARQQGDVPSLTDVHHAFEHGSCLPIRTDLLLPSGT
jgi:hypothetical protein